MYIASIFNFDSIRVMEAKTVIDGVASMGETVMDVDGFIPRCFLEGGCQYRQASH